MFHLNNIRDASCYVDGDAEIAASASQHLPTAGVDHSEFEGGGKRQKTERIPGGGKRTKGMAQPVGVEPRQVTPAPTITPQVIDGHWNANRQGKPLCRGFQKGSCKGHSCPNGRQHQCSKCLDNKHGAFGSQPCNKLAAARDGVPGGKGKNKKGRGKGRG